MHELPSAEFRKRYASLRESVVVTVHGHVIGRWTPAASAGSPGPETPAVELSPIAHEPRPSIGYSKAQQARGRR